MALEVLFTCCPPAPLAEGVLANVLFPVDVDFHVLDVRQDVDRGEAGVATALGVEGADPHQAVHAPLAREEAEGVGPAHPQRHPANARLLAFQTVHLFHAVAGPLEVPQVHPQEHLGPVAALGPARPGVDGEVAVARVVRAGQHRPQLQAVQVVLDLPRLDGRLDQRFVAAFLDGHLVQHLKVLHPAQQRVHRRHHRLEGFQVRHHFLGGLLVVPEARLGHLGFHLPHPRLAFGNVKESPGWRRSGR